MTALILIVIGLFPPPPGGKLPPIERRQRLGRADCRWTLESNSVELSGQLRLRLTVDGPAPVEIDLPRPLTASPDWQVTPMSPHTEALPDGREHWRQLFILKPFQTGKVPLTLKPLRVRVGNELRDWELAWPEMDVHVSSSVKNVDLGAARSVTDIERIEVEEPPTALGWYAGLALAGAAIILGLAIWSIVCRRGRVVVVRSPADQALAALRELEAGGPMPEQLPYLADVVRRFLEGQFRLAATRQTTAEFQETLRAAGVLNEAQAVAVAELLAQCDLVKFAGACPGPEECAALLRRAQILIAEAGPKGQTISTA